MTLDADLGYLTDGFEVDATFGAAPGETVVIVGPNGAGKTTVLDLVAGLRCLDRGSISLGGRTLDEPASGVWVPPEHRSTGYVHQDGVLFPHLTAVSNVAFGLRCRGVRRREAHVRATGWLERLGLGERLSAMPDRLSGGQAQRVALARALAPGPRLLLLDEPLGSLDPAARVELRRLLRRQLADFGGVALVVTHDPVDALALGDRLVVLDDGRVVQDGRPDEVARHPRSPHVAALVGLNLYPGRASGRDVSLEGGGQLSAAEPADGEVFVTVAPAAVSVHRHRPEGSPRNVWEASVAGMDVEGDRVRLDLAGLVPIVAEVTAAAVADLDIAEGARVWVSVKATEVTVYPA